MGTATPSPSDPTPYTVTLAREPADVRDVQRLRWRVFVEELGARVVVAEPGLDADRWDPHCDHLLVREAASGAVVGTYRMLCATRAAEAGGFYAESEFDLGGVRHLGPGLVEVGRACVAREHRNGVVLALLWRGLLGYLHAGGHAHVIGCASIELAHGPDAVAALCRRVARDHAAPAGCRVVPHRPLPASGVAAVREAPVPPLLKGYLRLGAEVCGEPAWDPAFDTADLLVHLPLARMSRRHATRLLRAA